MQKVGRNQPCPCGSGQKYKRCCGEIDSNIARAIPLNEVAHLIQRSEAREQQRQHQQGLGRQIISAEAKGTRFIAINDRVMHSKSWRTFIDFLGDYIKIRVGSEWGNNEIHNKPAQEMHQLIKWYQKICHLQKQYAGVKGEIYQSPKTGAVVAYYGLAYDLYCIDHNAAFQKALIERLKNPDQNFDGVRYEIAVAAILIRGGFTIEFEDESDRRTTHCEFTATSSRTGKLFSVECKRLESSPGDGQINIRRLGKRFAGALTKNANHTRVVFIDLNFPYDPKKNKNFPNVMEVAVNHIRKFESNQQNGGNLPPAFVFMTNSPHHYHLDDAGVSYAVITDGFKIPEYKPGTPYSLREAIDNREKHSDIHHLLDSIRRYSEIPTTFDGEIPEFAFNDELKKSRLLIGETYLIPDEFGVSVPGVLENAVVIETDKAANGIFRLNNGKRIIVKCDLNDEEIAAYKSHPETFFGMVNKSNQKAESPIELYDFFYNCYKNSPKDTLLSFFQQSPQYGELKNLPQNELARLYAEHCVNGVVSHQN